MMSIEKYFKRNIKAEPPSSSGLINTAESDTIAYNIWGAQKSMSDIRSKKDDVDAITYDKPNQARNFLYPKRLFGKHSHSFQEIWFKDCPWLHYNEEKDAAFCFICMNQEKKVI